MLKKVKERSMLKIHERFVLDEVTIDNFLSVLLVVYAYTGCDTVSAFSGQGHYVMWFPENSKSQKIKEFYKPLNRTEKHD